MAFLVSPSLRAVLHEDMDFRSDAGNSGSSHLRIKHFIAGEPSTVAKVLVDHFRLPPERIGELLHLGAIYSDKKRVFDDRPLSKGNYLRIHLKPKRFPARQIDWRSTLIADENEFLVFQKPAGIPVHATVDNAIDNALHQLREYTGYDLLVTNRLDIPVGGVMLFAKTASFQKRFNQWLLERKVTKFYRALVPLSLPSGKHVHFMEPGPRAPKIVSPIEKKGWQRCELTLHEVHPLGHAFEVKVELHTGRTHQIRAQLAALGSPLLGDRLYGSVEKYEPQEKGERIALFSSELSFPRYNQPAWSFWRDPPWASPLELNPA